mmetsp:Transcript_4924/g.10543  ORF Transcript_4924/g.10543 Transcript_4924/m.10543 type:complete len:165 (+) Transcript_4924:220-714(+)
MIYYIGRTRVKVAIQRVGEHYLPCYGNLQEKFVFVVDGSKREERASNPSEPVLVGAMLHGICSGGTWTRYCCTRKWDFGKRSCGKKLTSWWSRLAAVSQKERGDHMRLVNYLVDCGNEAEEIGDGDIVGQVLHFFRRGYIQTLIVSWFRLVVMNNNFPSSAFTR